MHLDNDDNGESAAGGRLAHLLQILVCIYHFVIPSFITTAALAAVGGAQDATRPEMLVHFFIHFISFINIYSISVRPGPW